MQYITYGEYVDLGGKCDNAAFDRNITRASAIIDTETHKRIWKMEAVPEEAKALCRDLVDLFDSNGMSSKVVTSKSQTAGAVSESESYATQTQEEVGRIATDIVYDYLMAVEDDDGTPLLYRGCADED